MSEMDAWLDKTLDTIGKTVNTPPPPPPPPARANPGGGVAVQQRVEVEDDSYAGEPLPEDAFEELDASFGTGRTSTVTSISVYRPPHPLEIPGSNFKVVRPGQKHVNFKIVEAKLEKGLPATPIIPVTMGQDGTPCLTDRHHTFVACMAIGRPVKLGMTQSLDLTRLPSWKSCTWKSFEKPKAAASGFSVSAEDSAAHEGQTVASGDWRSIVPWRKDLPTTPAGKVDAVKGKLAGVPEDALQDVCGTNPEVAERLFELAKFGGVEVEMRDAADGSSGGDWDATTGKIYIDSGMSETETVDMLVFEAGNAAHEHEYSELQHRAYDDAMQGDEYGEEKAAIEAKVTLEYLEFLIARKKAGKPIAPQGERALAAAEGRIPGYSDMDEAGRTAKTADMVAMISSTPHGGDDAELPDRLALSTKDLYAYERIVDTQQVKGLIAFFKKSLPKEHEKYGAFMAAIENFDKNRHAGVFYIEVTTAAAAKLGHQGFQLNREQTQVAEAEYAAKGENWRGTLRGTLDAL